MTNGPLSPDANEIRIEPQLLFDLDELAPGVRGYTVDGPSGELYVPLIVADEPGSGAGGRYLDSLPRDRTVKVPNVISSILTGMLRRRGFDPVWERASDESGDSHVEVYVRYADAGPTDV